MSTHLILFTLLSIVLCYVSSMHQRIDYVALKKQVEFTSFKEVCNNNIKEASAINTNKFSDAIKTEIKESITKMKKLMNAHNSKSHENANGSDVAKHLKEQCNVIKADIASNIEIATAIKPGTNQDVESFVKFCNDKVRSVEQEVNKQKPGVISKVKADVASLKKITSSAQVIGLQKSKRNSNFHQVLHSLFIKCTRDSNIVLDKIKPEALIGLEDTYDTCYANKKELDEQRKVFDAPTGVRKLTSLPAKELKERSEKYFQSISSYEQTLEDNLKIIFKIDGCIEDRPGDMKCVSDLYQHLSKPVPEVPDMLKELKAEYTKYISIMGRCVQQADDIIKKHLPVNGKFPKLEVVQQSKKESISLKTKLSSALKKSPSKEVDLPKIEEEGDDVKPDTTLPPVKKQSISLKSRLNNSIKRTSSKGVNLPKDVQTKVSKSKNLPLQTDNGDQVKPKKPVFKMPSMLRRAPREEVALP